ncbi:hypothetical protein EAE99_002803 [Botrytis elliptica]|nr:hypothetical protein EAE99_002803 [Botrytis elliptica]
MRRDMYVTFIPHSFRPHSAVSRFSEKGNFGRVNPQSIFFLFPFSFCNQRYLQKIPVYHVSSSQARTYISALVKRTVCILIGLLHLVENKKILREICRNSQGKFDSDRP